MQNKTARVILWVLFAACMLVLVKNILFKKSPQHYKNYFARYNAQQAVKSGWKLANFKPFATIRLFYRSRQRTEYKVNNIAGNIIGFAPLGILLPLLFTRLQKFWKTFGMVLFISLAFETIQLLTGLGVFDVDDLILNSAGGLGGYFIFSVFRKIH
ncbi:MAG: VanZ family protein [Chitinophagaceae bacterium]|nr:VanZ family protein [Chitinophagaceae bacterium]